MTASRTSRVLLVVSALLMAVGLASCTAGAADGGGTPRDEAHVTTFAGLHVAGDVAVVASDDRMTLVSTRSCDDLSAMLGAGQWRLVDRVSHAAIGDEAAAMLAGFGGVAGDLLQRGDAIVFAALEGGAMCTATVAPAVRGSIALEGSGMPGSTPGWVATTRCYVSKETGDITVSFYFDTESRIGGQGQLVLIRSGDGYLIDAEDSSSITLNLLAHGDRFLTALTAAFASSSDLPVIALVPGAAFSGTATVATGARGLPSGEVALRGLLASEDGYDDEYDEYSYDEEYSDGESGDVTITLPFGCPAVIETR